MTVYNREEITTLMKLQREQGLKHLENTKKQQKENYEFNKTKKNTNIGWSAITSSFRTSSKELENPIQYGENMNNDNDVNIRNSTMIIEEDEVDIIYGALKYRDMFVIDVMTPADNVYMLASTDCLSYKVLLYTLYIYSYLLYISYQHV